MTVTNRSAINWDNVRKYLNALGDNSYEVAETLKQRGVTGQPNEPSSCPIAQVLKRRWPTKHFLVGPTLIYNLEGNDTSDIVTPLIIAYFIARFDNYDWPDLVS